MATLKIFVSFEFDKDRDLRGQFYEQAKPHARRYRISNSSLREAYKTEKWKDKARAAIRECDAVIVLVGPDTHNAPGVRTEVDMARSFGKPTVQVRSHGRPYKGVPGVKDLIPWKWSRIEQWLDQV